MGGAERDDESVSSPTSPSPSSSSCSSSPSSSFQREAFRKAVTSKSLRRFLEVFMETQMFTGFIQERDLRRQGLRGTDMWRLHYLSPETFVCCSFWFRNREIGLKVPSEGFLVNKQKYCLHLLSLPSTKHHANPRGPAGVFRESLSLETSTKQT